jgi:hypothetical protein
MVTLAACLVSCAYLQAGEPDTPRGKLRSIVAERLPVLGHRNWIVVADLAYPAQSRAGIETVYVGGDQLEAVKETLDLVEKAPHVRGAVFIDAEQEYVPEDDAAGIARYRDQLTGLLQGRDAQRLPHEEIIAMLDEAAEMFRIVILKTDMTIPYTTVFIRLECGYWGDEAEQSMRAKMAADQ